MSTSTIHYRCLFRPEFTRSRKNGLSDLTKTARNRPSTSSHTQCRTFHTTQPKHQERRSGYYGRMKSAWRDTKVQWYAIPVSLGVGFLGATRFYQISAREKARREEDESAEDRHLQDEKDDKKKPKKRPRIRPSGPWSVQVMSTLPLKAFSRWWGWFNELDIPYYLRVPGFRLYSAIFGVNLSEVAQEDLRVYPNLAAFFYRQLKPGARPLDPNLNTILSPADGKVVQFGMIEHGEVEQIKGVTYSLDALLGAQSPSTEATPTSSAPSSRPATPRISEDRSRVGDEEIIRSDEEFASVNGISYTLQNVFQGQQDKNGVKIPVNDQSTTPLSSSEAEVRADFALSDANKPWWAPSSAKTPTALYFCVIYLAPGDYHRFHSPVSWVVESRRHFAGELYSVSPFLVKNLPGLFTLNERVVLLGKWRWGFFSYTPVGATNVGSIIVNFDKELRTNSLTTDTATDRAAENAANQGEAYGGFSEATYAGASTLLRGHALKRGEEMGGFQLGSTVVMVFEAPKSKRRASFDQGWEDERRAQGGFKWGIEKGQKVKMGQAIGEVLEDS